jgi:hypothetical protein
MKVQKVSQTITPFAGISFIHEEFKNPVHRILLTIILAPEMDQAESSMEAPALH